MRYIEVLCEGSSDVPALREVLVRRFKLSENDHFRIHPHQGKGKLPEKAHRMGKPDRANNSLLHQLPIKLKNMGQQSQGGFEVAVIVVVDADNDDCVDLKKQLLDLYAELPTKPPRCLFRIAVEETESWFIAEPNAVKKAYPRTDTAALARLGKDAICGAWECLARAIGVDRAACGGGEKTEWAAAISPHLNLTKPESPSLSALVTGVVELLK
ncbi:MAG TPA: DUF4276 family protein [Tepidisphaeraceae bacterium]|jgi:hypothetical protein